MKISLPPQPMLLPSPVLIIGTYDKTGKPNIMNAAWGGIACSKPPCINISLREATLTYHNIRDNHAFTVNFASEKYLKEADFAGIVSGRELDKFSLAGLTPGKSEKVNAPFVQEFPVALECKLIHEISLGSHTMFVGEIIGMVCEDSILNEMQLPDIEKVKPVIWGSFGSMAYYSLGNRLGSAFSVGKEIKP